MSNGKLPVDLAFVAPLGIAVVAGGYIGASLGSKKLGRQGLRTALGVVLCVAAGKMLYSMESDTNNEPSNAIKSTHE